MKLLLLSIIVALGAYIYIQQTRQDRIDSLLPTNVRMTLGATDLKQVSFMRQSNGLLRIDADDPISFARGLGYAHAHDRYVQLFTTRLIVQGRLSECLAATEESLMIDKYMRQTGFVRNAERNLHALNQQTRNVVQAYADGINAYLGNHSRSIEFVLAGYTPEPWTVLDSVSVATMVGYIGLASGQGEQEKFIIQALKSGNKNAKKILQRLYKPHFDNIDDFLPEDILKKVRVELPLVPHEMELFKSIPQLVASNNWIVGSSKSESGKPLMAFDPHLDISRLPGFWYETVGNVESTKTYVTGITLPGLTGFAMGRNEKLSMSFTYGSADLIDYFIEECKDMKCRDGDDWVPVEKIVSVIKRKGLSDVEVVIFKTHNGYLELANSSRHDFEDGFYLARAYSHDRGVSGVGALAAISTLYTHKTIEALEKDIAQADISMNLLAVDTNGDMGYFQTGLIPIRAHSGLFPVLGWKKEHQWKGFVPGEELHRIKNPKDDILVTANNLFNGKHMVINLHMGEHRADRIKELLAAKPKYNVEDMKDIQTDVYSKQAADFMKFLGPVLQKKKGNPLAYELSKWDFRYNRNSRGAFLFESWYRALLKRVYGRLAGPSWDILVRGPTFITYFHYLDNVILEYDPADDSILWHGKSREELFSEVFDSTVLELQAQKMTETRYGQWHTLTLYNQFFKAVLPENIALALGIHRGPLPFEGSRATPKQAQKFAQGTMDTTFAPSFRFVTDLATNTSYSVFPGGPSGNFLSPLYANELDSFINNRYKVNQP